jgi:hypothetical protein
MAVNIRIGTAFDGKGLGIAQRELGNLKSSVGALRSNFLLLGAALTGAAAIITTNVQSLARIETINAQTAQTITTMGNAANISAGEVEALAGRLESLTAVEAESIQEGANLLLTFGNIRDELGEGNDIFSQTTEIMVDMGVALRKGPVETATMLGKALNDPIQGLTALRRVGVSFTEQQIEQVRVLQQSGDLMGAQKLILAELQNQYGGSGAAYAATFTGQLELMGHELGAIGEEATMAVMPALQMMVEELRELIPVIGPQLKAAIESVDWKGLITAVVDFTRFLVTNAEVIAKSVAALWALSTIAKTVNVVFTLGKVAADLYAWGMAQVATKTGIATVATNLLRVAMLLIPWVLIATGIALIVTGIVELGDESKRNKPYVDAYGGAIRKSGQDAEWAAGRYGIATDAANKFTGAIGGAVTTSAAYDRAELNRFKNMADASKAAAAEFPKALMPDFSSLLGGGAGGGASASIAEPVIESINQVNEAQVEAARKEQEILDKRRDAFKSFRDSVKTLFGQIKDSIMSAFSLPDLGNSVNSITKNINKLLAQTKNFASNISKLSSMGLNSTLLQQVIAAGPEAGSRLAASLASGGSGVISQINQAYSEFGGLASGIAQTGTAGAFANRQTINNYSIAVTGGLATGADVGRAVVNAISSYERQSGAAWRA